MKQLERILNNLTELKRSFKNMQELEKLKRSFKPSNELRTLQKQMAIHLGPFKLTKTNGKGHFYRVECLKTFDQMSLSS